MVRASTGVSVAGIDLTGENGCWGSLYCQVYEAHGCRGRACPKSVIASVLHAASWPRERSGVKLPCKTGPSAPRVRSSRTPTLVNPSHRCVAARRVWLTTGYVSNKSTTQHRLISSRCCATKNDEDSSSPPQLIHAAAALVPPGTSNARTCLPKFEPADELGARRAYARQARPGRAAQKTPQEAAPVALADALPLRDGERGRVLAPRARGPVAPVATKGRDPRSSMSRKSMLTTPRAIFLCCPRRGPNKPTEHPSQGRRTAVVC